MLNSSSRPSNGTQPDNSAPWRLPITVGASIIGGVILASCVSAPAPRNQQTIGLSLMLSAVIGGLICRIRPAQHPNTRLDKQQEAKRLAYQVNQLNQRNMLTKAEHMLMDQFQESASLPDPHIVGHIRLTTSAESESKPDKHTMLNHVESRRKIKSRVQQALLLKSEFLPGRSIRGKTVLAKNYPNIAECQCVRALQRKPNSARADLEYQVLAAATRLKAQSKTPHLVSVGAGQLLQEITLLNQLSYHGFQNLTVALIDPIYHDQYCIDDSKSLFSAKKNRDMLAEFYCLLYGLGFQISLAENLDQSSCQKMNRFLGSLIKSEFHTNHSKEQPKLELGFYESTAAYRDIRQRSASHNSPNIVYAVDLDVRDPDTVFEPIIQSMNRGTLIHVEKRNSFCFNLADIRIKVINLDQPTTPPELD